MKIVSIVDSMSSYPAGNDGKKQSKEKHDIIPFPSPDDLGSTAQINLYKGIQEILALPKCLLVRPCLITNKQSNPFKCAMHTKCSAYQELFKITK